MGQLRLVFQPIIPNETGRGFLDTDYLVYAQKLVAVRASGDCDPRTGLFRLKRATLPNSGALFNRFGAVVAAHHIRTSVHVAPFYGESARLNYSAKTLTEASAILNLNKYSDKETYMLLR